MEARWTKELRGDVRVAGGAAFQARGVSLGDDFGELTSGAVVRLNDRTFVQGSYTGRVADRAVGHGGVVQLNIMR